MKTSLLLVTLAASVMPVTVVAQEAQPPAQPTQREHIVRPGDTLWDLAREYLNDPHRWPAIFEANRRTVENSHWIFPRERLVIPTFAAYAAPVSAELLGVPAALLSDPAIAASVVTETVAVDVPAVITEASLYRPPVLPSQFHSAAWLQDTTRLRAVGRVVQIVDPRSEQQEIERTAFPYERVYVAYEGLRPEIGTRLSVVQIGRDIERWGHVVEPVAVLEVVAQADEVYTARVVAQSGAIEPHAAVVAIDSFPLREGMEAGVVSGGAEGQIIGFVDEQELPGIYERGFLSVGRAAGVGVGDEFDAYVPERTSRKRLGNAELAEEHVARLRVIRTTDRTATFIVTELTHPVLAAGMPVRLVRAVR